MKNTNEKLSEALNVEPIEIVPKELVIDSESSSIDDDAEYARTNIRELIEKGNVAMENLLHVAKESEHPRAYEVAANMLKNLTDMNKDLLEIQKRKRDLKPQTTQQNISVDKAVFIGSTTELLKQLKELK
jgi:hypothetical protein